jgi:hypothetical protein
MLAAIIRLEEVLGQAHCLYDLAIESRNSLRLLSNPKREWKLLMFILKENGKYYK